MRYRTASPRNHSSHPFVAASAKVVAVKRKRAHLIRDKLQPVYFSRANVYVNSQARTIESVQPGQ